MFRTLPDFDRHGVGKGSVCFDCGVHKTGRREHFPIIQIDRRIHMEGYIQLCGQCIEQYANACGISVNEDAVTERIRAEFEVETDTLREENDALTAEVEAYRAVIRDALDSGGADE